MPRRSNCLFWVGFCLLVSIAALVRAQTTQGTIAGRVFDRSQKKPLAGARIFVFDSANQLVASTVADSQGFYLVGLLSPQTYRMRAEKDGYQAQQVDAMELAVASQLEFVFQLRPESDFFGMNTNQFSMVGRDRILPFFGEDTMLRSAPVEVISSNSITLQPVVSSVVDSREIEALPLAGRDVYTILALQAGVTSDTSTARGLGLSVNGQRPSSANYLLDGVQNNNYLVTGPLINVAPEVVQEYRFSTNSFSAEYGRTAGFIANTVTRQGGNDWHARSWWYLKNDYLNANDFERNAAGLPITPLRSSEPGLLFGGPLIRDRLYILASGEYTHFRSSDAPQTYQLPTENYRNFAQPGSIARTLLDRFAAAPIIAPAGQATAHITIAPPSSESSDQLLVTVRADALFHGGTRRLTIRPILASLLRPDFLWTPYKDFITPLRQTDAGAALTLTTPLGKGSSEARFGFSRDHLNFARRWPGIPTLTSGDGTTLPGSPAFYGFEEKGTNFEAGEHVIVPANNHLLRFGGGVLIRGASGYLSAGRDSLYSFQDFSSFAADQPFILTTSISRATPVNYSLPDFTREYRYFQASLFAEDSFHVTSRLTVDLGLRYESYRPPVNTGRVKDALVQLGTGQSFGERISTAKLVFPGPEHERLYDPDNMDFAGRGGFAYAIQRNGGLVLRGSYGMFYDPPFDNEWESLRNNNFTTTGFAFNPPAALNYLQPTAGVLAKFIGYPYSRSFPNLTLYQPKLRNGYAQNFFLGLQKALGSVTIELNGLGSLGRRLLTTDLVNRRNSVPYSVTPFTGQFNSSLPEISYRGSQGGSDYYALTLLVRRRKGSVHFQAGYTLSHAIDNQSDPLAGDFFDLDFTRIVAGLGTQNGLGFTRQFDSRGDRANADFDQRQSFVGTVIWDLPRWSRYRKVDPFFRDWTVAALGAARTGFPYSVYVQPVLPSGQPELVNNRADIVNPSAVYVNQSVEPGGRLLLNSGALAVPVPGQLGNSGRNAFLGPGLASLDVTLSRSFSVSAGDRAIQFTLRADAFNALNHANLNNPASNLSVSGFGVATFGRKGDTTGFPAVAPFNETARQIQVMLRVAF